MKFLAQILVLAAVGLLAACGGGGGSAGVASSGPQGTIRVAITDAPVCGYEHVWVTVQKVRVDASEAAAGEDRGAADIVMSPPLRIDLASLTNGVLEELGAASLPAGHYTQLRVYLAPNSTSDPLANAVQPTGGTPVPLDTPSGTQSGIKVGHAFDVAAGQTADLVLDFDACRSVTRAGNSGRYILNPVITARARTQTVVVTGERTVNTTAQGFNLFPTAAPLPDGGSVVAWYYRTGDSSTSVIRFQRYAADGTAAGGEVTVPGSEGAGQSRFDVVQWAGGFAISWVGAQYKLVYMQLFDSAGVPVGSRVQVNTTGYLFATIDRVRMAALNSGGFVVTWIGDVDNEVFVRRFDATGAAVGAQIGVNGVATRANQTADVSGLADGGFVVAWTANGRAGTGIFAQRFDVNGAQVGGNTRLHASVAGKDTWLNSVAGLPDDGYVVTWSTGLESLNDFDVYAQRFDAAGAPLAPDAVVNTTTANWQEEADIAALPGGGWLIAWQSIQAPLTGWDVMAQRFDATGARVDGEVLVNTSTAGNQQDARISVLAGGGYAIVWDSLPDASGNTLIKLQRFSATGERL